MSKPNANGVEKVIPKGKLEGLLKANDVVSSRINEERGAFGSKIKKAVEEDNLSKFAFDVAKRLRKMDEAKAAREWRMLKIYVEEHLKLDAQGDLMDQEGAQDDETGEEDETREADEFTDPIRQTMEASSTDNPEAAIARLRSSLADAPNATAVERGLARFVKDHPDLADQAHEVAQARMAAIASAPPADGFRRKRQNLKGDAGKVLHS